MKTFRTAVRADVARYDKRAQISVWDAIGTVLSHPGLQAVLTYRFGRLLHAGRARPALRPLLVLGWAVYGLATLLVRKAYAIHLASSADIGPGFYVGHFGGIVLVNCTVGAHCSVAQQTRVGSLAEPSGPQVGDRVWIGAHARIVGPVQVGDGTAIAPGAVVTKNIPRRSLVVGSPGRIVRRDYDTTPIL
jgi:serine O-acetyltransferase